MFKSNNASSNTSINLTAQTLHAFLRTYGESLHSLCEALDEARISHYSSGNGAQSIAFDIFPASQCVGELLQLLTLDRMHITQTAGQLKDANSKSDYNPANDFLLFLKRWTTFAEQTMRREGGSLEGVAAARAKLIMDDLSVRLSEGKPGQTKTTAFARLMQSIGLSLEANEQSQIEHRKRLYEQEAEYNYRQALAAANGSMTVVDREFSYSKTA